MKRLSKLVVKARSKADVLAYKWMILRLLFM
jgi:hypothetical protein